jgi:hypothetical protein
MPATWTKLKSGAWGIRVTGGAPSSGDTVTVSKKDGTQQSVTVEKVVWTGGDVALCAIEAKPRSGSGRSGRRYECGEYVTPGSSCWETGMSH